jgi:hypothetical protein
MESSKTQGSKVGGKLRFELAAVLLTVFVTAF